MKYIYKELYRHKRRTIAGISGYFIASLFLILILSLNYSQQNDSVGILRSTGTHFIVYLPSTGSCCRPGCEDPPDGSLIAEGGYTMMLNSDVIETVRATKGLRAAAPYLLYKLNDRNLQCDISLGGIDTSNIATKSNVCAADNLISGTYLKGKKGEVVAEESFAMAHKIKVGDTLQTFGGKLVVGGIVNSGIKPGKADLYAPIDDVKEILKGNLQCISDGFDMNIILVEVADARIQPRVMNDIRKQLSNLAISSYNCYQPASNVIGILESAGTVLSVVIFLFLLIFSAKTQLTALMERYREIGILKSLGWKDSSLSIQIVATSLIQALTGSLSGIITGLVIAFLSGLNGTRILNSFEFIIQPAWIPVIILLCLGGAVIATIMPVIRLYRTEAGEMINSYN
jgi:putative ABC transport system permease protein